MLLLVMINKLRMSNVAIMDKTLIIFLKKSASVLLRIN